MKPEDVIPLSSLAEQAGVTRMELSARALEKKFPAVKVGNQWFVRIEDIPLVLATRTPPCAFCGSTKATRGRAHFANALCGKACAAAYGRVVAQQGGKS